MKEKYVLEDPFDAQFDPMFLHLRSSSDNVSVQKQDKQPGISRRQILIGTSMVACTAPTMLAASNLIPCHPVSQKNHRCSHKFCKHYRGFADYYDR